MAQFSPPVSLLCCKRFHCECLACAFKLGTLWGGRLVYTRKAGLRVASGFNLRSQSIVALFFTPLSTQHTLSSGVGCVQSLH